MWARIWGWRLVVAGLVVLAGCWAAPTQYLCACGPRVTLDMGPPFAAPPEACPRGLLDVEALASTHVDVTKPQLIRFCGWFTDKTGSGQYGHCVGCHRVGCQTP
jgi:hypothetical protein